MDTGNPTNPAPAPAPEGGPAAGNTGGAGDTLDLTIGRAEYEALLSARREADQLRAQQTQAARSVEDRVAAIESRYRAAASAGAIEAALGGLQFVTDQARADARALIRADVEVREDPQTGEAVAYHRPSGRPLAQVPAAEMQARFAHLLAPMGRGGSGAAGALPSGYGGHQQQPRTPGEALLELALQRQGGPRRHPMLGDDLK